MKLFAHPHRLLLLSPLLGCLSISAPAQNGSMLGQSITWRRTQSPFTPDSASTVILGGPGSDPNPGTPMYICRARVQGSLVPGKWVQGNCNVAFGGSEQIMRSYEVAYGSARWVSYRGSPYGLAQTGSEADGSPLYSCRVHYYAGGTDYGYQPGKLVSDGTCHIPMGGGEVAQNPPFEVLYATGGGRPPIPYPYPYPPVQPVQPAQPYPPCRLSDPTVKREIRGGTSWLVGPRCSSTDAFGNVEPKYPQPGDDAPPPPYDPGPSSVTWQPAQTPFVPGDDAVKGGPGNGPKPDSPLYVCRVYDNNALVPGKWVQGQCNYVNDAGKEDSSKTYEVATGPAEWRNFDGNIGALVPGGYLAGGMHLYICRKQISYFGSKKGYQPGFLANGKCHIPYGVDNVVGPPFDALYNVVSAQPAQSPAPAVGAAQPHGILISFLNGTGATAGTVTVTNGSSGSTVTKPLPPNSTAQQCMEIVQQAAFQAGLQIQAQPDGSGLRVFGSNNAVNVTQASVSVSQF
ncbi:MAG: DM9 repeat-containing protein [Alloacidobacterium sp.]